MDPIESLKTDHRKVEELFEQFESSKSNGSRSKRDIVKEIVAELTLHTRIEEKVVYPFVREWVPDLEENVLEAYEEHRVVKNTLRDLGRVKANDERLDAMMKVLKENVKHHVEEEENEVLPKLGAACSEEELMMLGEQLEEARGAGARRRASKKRPVSRRRRAA